MTPRVCASYCRAAAAREGADCAGEEPADCSKYPECVRQRREMRAACAKIRADTAAHCGETVCAEISKMPPPPG
ncbi:MAG: hypothetical protein IT376_16680 [Polyangiaceae bacterium]|nr:hypothetical protein [Polyangiaceae bacterium]